MRTTHTLAALAFSCLIAATSNAAAIAVGKALPPISIEELGECIIEGGETAYRPWQSSHLRGRVHVLEYMAARAGIQDVQQPLYDAIKAADFPAERFAIAQVVNADDALFGTSGLVGSEVRKSKKQHPEVTLVVDMEGVGLKAWALQSKSSAVAIVDAAGTVLFFKERAMTSDEIAFAIDLIRQHTGSAEAATTAQNLPE